MMMVIIWLMMVNNLVGGAITILKNMTSSMGRMTSHIWNGKFKKCLKPPTSHLLCPFSIGNQSAGHIDNVAALYPVFHPALGFNGWSKPKFRPKTIPFCSMYPANWGLMVWMMIFQRLKSHWRHSFHAKFRECRCLQTHVLWVTLCDSTSYLYDCSCRILYGFFRVYLVFLQVS